MNKGMYVQADGISLDWHHGQCRRDGPKGLLLCCTDLGLCSPWTMTKRCMVWNQQTSKSPFDQVGHQQLVIKTEDSGRKGNAAACIENWLLFENIVRLLHLKGSGYERVVGYQPNAGKQGGQQSWLGLVYVCAIKSYNEKQW